MSSSISRRFPGTSSVRFTWGCCWQGWLLQHDIQDGLGEKGTCRLESSRSLVSRRETTSMGPHPVSVCCAPWPGVCQRVARPVVYVQWLRGSALRAQSATSLVQTAACEGALPLVDSRVVHHVSLLYCLGSRVLWFFFL